MFDQFTLGIEEEFQIVDPVTRELKSHVSEILEEGKLLLGEKIKPEMIQSMIEVGTEAPDFTLNDQNNEQVKLSLESGQRARPRPS